MGWGTRGAKTKILDGMAKKGKERKEIAGGTQHFFPWLSGLILFYLKFSILHQYSRNNSENTKVEFLG